jgi:hypothetical protein
MTELDLRHNYLKQHAIAAGAQFPDAGLWLI